MYVDVRRCTCMYGWMHGCMYGWMDVWMDVRMHAGMYVTNKPNIIYKSNKWQDTDSYHNERDIDIYGTHNYCNNM